MSVEQQKPTYEELEQRVRKLEEENQRAREFQSSFFRNISHELRTPMNSIIGFSGLLNDPGFSHEERNDFITTIRQSSFSLLGMIENLLDLAQIEQKQMSYNEEECNITDTLSELYKELDSKRVKAEKHNIILNTNRKQLTTDFNVLTDGSKLKSLLTNLLDNALKFTHTGHIDFGYTTSQNNITFYVIDTGKGISKDEQVKIFDKFNQVSPSTKHVSNGMGMGLAISKGIAEVLGGKIWFESSAGNGSSFFFEMPLKVQKKRTKKTVLEIPTRSLYYSAS